MSKGSKRQRKKKLKQAELRASLISENIESEIISEKAEEIAEDNSADNVSIEETAEESTEKNNPKLHKTLIFLASVLINIVFLICIWYFVLPKTHDLVVELGTESIGISEFLTESALPQYARFDTDPETVDITKVSSTDIVINHLGRKESVTLSIVDTTAPEIILKDVVLSGLKENPSPEDFIQSVKDESSWTVSYEKMPSLPSEYTQQDVSIVVTDEYGNTASASSQIVYTWMRDELIVEYGQKITEDDIIIDKDAAKGLVAAADIDKINKSDLGEYSIETVLDGMARNCKIVIQDTTPPELELKNVTLIISQNTDMNAFIKTARDNYSDVELTLLSEFDFSALGNQTVVIEAKDKLGNVSVKEANLRIKEDDEPPVFYGLYDIWLEKHSGLPDLSYGVSAIDGIDGARNFTFDTSRVNVDVAGTYFVIYYSSDSKGNTSSATRRVFVNYNYEDKGALLDALYASIPDKSLYGITNYIRWYIYYSYEWGGSDPVLFGLVNRRGNCYVHALILQEMLNRAGIPNMLCNCISGAHYWNIVFYDGKWIHADSTEIAYNPPILRNDAQNYELVMLRGWGDWDRSLYPECP